jgi:hypothetical protein
MVALALLSACAPAYRPPTPFVPLLESQGDAHVAAHLGTGGMQLDGAYAVSPHFAVRGGGQFAGYAGQGDYLVGSAGAGAYGAFSGPGGRGTWAVTGVVGSGYTHGQSAFTIITPDAETTQEFRTSGGLVTGALRGEWGLESDVLGWGAQVGPTWHLVAHDRKSDEDGVGQMVMFEAATAVRGGPPGPVRAELSLGFALPMWVNRTDAVGVPVPLVVGLGVTGDLSK